MASSSLIMGNNMHVKYLAGIVGAALLMAGCSSSNELSAAGQSVRIVDEQPGAECQLIGTATGKQSNWLSGQHGEEGGSMRLAARPQCVHSDRLHSIRCWSYNPPSVARHRQSLLSILRACYSP